VTGRCDLLAIAAHPDDVEIGCGGAVALAAASGQRVMIADLTRGERSTAGDVRTRAREAERARELLGAVERTNLELPDGELGDASHRDAIIALLRELRPRIVLAPYESDRHPDHAAAGALTRMACFGAGVGDPSARPERLYHYMLHHPFEPAFVLDITAVWERRMRALAAYESQFGGGPTEISSGFGDLLGARAAFYGSLVGVERGEPYTCAGPLGLRNLPGLGAGPTRAAVRYRAYV